MREQRVREQRRKDGRESQVISPKVPLHLPLSPFIEEVRGEVLTISIGGAGIYRNTKSYK